MTENTSAGCRTVALAGMLLIATAIAFMVVGLSMLNQDECGGLCETVGFTLFYAGLPVSAVIGVGLGELVLAWPLDITFWVVLTFVISRLAERRNVRPIGLAVAGIAIALIYGLVLSQFVEIAI